MSLRDEYYKLKNKDIAPVEKTKKQESFLDFIGKTLSTGAYGLSKIGTGVLQGAENIADFTTHILGQGIGSAVGIVNKEAGENVKDFAKRSAEHDIIENTLTKHIDKVYGENSYGKEIVGGVAEGVGEMIPTVILGGGATKVLQGSKVLTTMASKGKTLEKTANLVAKTGGMLPFMTSAGGSSINKALDEGAEYDEALKYGVSKGATEGAIESIFGGIGGIAGKGIKGVLDNKIIKKVIQNTSIRKGLENLTNKTIGKAGIVIGDITVNGLGEGVEEVASAILDPYLQRLTYNEQAELASSDELMENFAMGVLTSVLFQGGAKVLQNKAPILNKKESVTDSVNKPSNQVIEQENNIVDKQIVETNKSEENGNTEQNNIILQNNQENIVEKDEISQNQLENNKNTMYNNVESDGGINGEIFQGTVRGDGILANEIANEERATSNTRVSQGNISVDFKQEREENYKKFIEYANNNKVQAPTQENIELQNKAKELGLNAILYNGNNQSDYYGMTDKDNPNNIYIDIKQNEIRGEDILYHEFLHSRKRNNDNVYMDKIAPIEEDIVNNYSDIIDNFIDKKGLDEAYKKYPNLIAEEIIADYSAKHFSGYNIDYGLPSLYEENINQAFEEMKQNIYKNDIQLAPLLQNDGVEKTQNEAPKGPLKGAYDDVLPEEMKKDRKWAATVKRAEALDQKLIREIMKKNPEDYIYVQQSNARQVENADLIIKNNGYKESIKLINEIFDSGKSIKGDDLALAQRLLQEASNRGDSKTVSELLPKVTQMGTELGQAVQSLSIIKKLSPTGQLKYLQTTITRMKKTELDNITNQKFMPKSKKEGRIKQLSNLEITPQMAEKILNTNTKEELDNAISEVVNEIASKLPSTLFEKLDTWRYLSMLGNPRTHIRNFIGNTTMAGTRRIKDTIAASIEDVVSKINPNAMKERSKTLKKPTEFIKKYAEEQTKIAKSDLSGQSKYTMENAIQRAKKAFGTEGFGGFVQKLADKNSDLLELEDTLFKGVAYKKAFRDYLTANGMKTQKDIDNNSNLVANAREYATEEALKATFQQYSALASWINRLENKNAFSKVATGAIIPFKKTPINIAKTGASYSPLGLAKSITYDIYQLNTGKLTVPQFIDNISQGLTGTSIMAIGIALYNLGLLNPGSDDDKDGKYDKALGKQEYSVRIGDKTFTLDWLSPVSMPLFAGAEFAKSLTEGESDIESYSNMITSTLDPMMSMSVLQGINNAISSFEENKIQSIIENSITGYISQLFPTLGGQINKTIDPTVRTTSVSKDSNFSLLERIIRTNMNKIPGMSFLLEPSTDVWGNEVKRPENVIERAADNFLMPYNVKEDITTNIDNELKKVYSETGKDEVIPTISVSKTITYGGEKYETNSETYTQFKKTYGQVSNGNLEKLFNTKTYKNADYEEKANLIDKVYEYARDEAKKEFLATKDVEYTNKTKDGVKTYEKNAIVDVIKEDISYQSAVYKREYPTKYTTITQITNYDKYKEYDEDIKEIQEKYKGTGTKYSEQKKKEIISKINSYKLNIPQKAMLIKQYYSSFDDYNKQIVEYINKQKLSKAEKTDVLKQLGFTIKDGRVTW